MRRSDPKENKKRFFRAGDRIVNQNGAWYFTAREGDVGPFKSRSSAELEVQRFLLERAQLSKFQRSRSGLTKQVPKKTPKPVSRRGRGVKSTQQTRHHLDQQVASDGLMLTLDEDFLL